MSDRSRSRGRGRGQSRGDYRNRRGHLNGHADRQSAPNSSVDGELNAHHSEGFRGKASRRKDNGGRETGNDGLNAVLNPDVLKYVKSQDAIAQSVEPDDWLALPEIPSLAEICFPEGAAVVLPPNRIDKPWSKKEKYLKAHYKLLREDATAPLREAVNKFRKDSQRMDDNSTRIYDHVRVVGLTFTFKGIASRIRFSTARSGRKILWSSSKRLVSGTLVALSPSSDNFHTQCILATVAARPLQNLEGYPPEIDILFGDLDSHEINAQKEYVMIEATQGYYEAYRHTLRALQKQSQERFPLAEHICQLQQVIDAPDYLKKNPERDMTPAADEETEKAYRKVNLLEDWPAPSKTLDKTQWAAMREILTKKLAIIQGPPGTGKTHVSKIAIDILLRNRLSTDPPIIVACQTNHALDQLLELIHKFETKFIRLGGRSSSILVKARALYEVRKNEIIDDIAGSVLSKARRDLSQETMKLKSLLSPVHEDAPASMTADVLFHLGVISDEQRKSLQRGADQWVRSDAAIAEPLQMWLGKAVSPFVPLYGQEAFGFEEAEEDLEFEQLRELDAENGVTDEEDAEMLRGDYLPINMGLTMPQLSADTLDQAKRILDTAKDLYRVQGHLKGPVWMVMQQRAKAVLRYRLRDGAKAYAKITNDIQIGRWEKDVVYLQRAPIIGMTTTGLSKYRALISALKPKIVLIEEAAEVLEAPVGVACVESLEHLILVGDHQQLQAHCSVRELEGQPYHLNISMFERLVRNQIPHKTLLRQRRMEPDFRHLIASVYPQLQDHQRVIDRPRATWGMGKNISWFFNHQYQELQDEQMSTFNEHEARLIAKFYRHIVRNGVPPAAITVLTFYNGQRKKILKELKKEPETASAYNIVKTVDSYQGEENHIVILSLVRNNVSGKIGFLDINNRIVVALSRAKYGFYIFGNGGFLAEHNELWDYVETEMYKKERSCDQMPLTCTNHGNEVWVQYPEDFDQLDGGCTLSCRETMPCGHTCPMKCHPYPHDRVLCGVKCNKQLRCGHFCIKACKDDCGCNCEEYKKQQAEIEEPVPIDASQWNSLASKMLTKENVLRLRSDEKSDLRILPRNGVDSNNSRLPPSAVQNGSHLNSNQPREGGRTRYEQAWTSSEHAQPLAQSFEHISIDGHQEPQQSAREGKLPEQPQRQPRGPSAWNNDGAHGWGQQESRHEDAHAAQAQPSSSSWENEPAPDVDFKSAWVDPETMKFDMQQREALGDAFW